MKNVQYEFNFSNDVSSIQVLPTLSPQKAAQIYAAVEEEMFSGVGDGNTHKEFIKQDNVWLRVFPGFNTPGDPGAKFLRNPRRGVE